MAQPAVGQWGGGTEGQPHDPASATSVSPAVLRSPRVSAGTAACREPFGPPAPSPSPLPRPRVLALVFCFLQRKKSLFPKRRVLSPVEDFEATPGVQGGASFLLPWMFLGEGCVPGAAPPTFPVRCVTYMAATCLGATSRRASAPPLVTPPGRSREARPSCAPPPRRLLPRPCRSAPQSGLPAPAPGRKAGGLVTCPRRSRNSSGGEESFPKIRGIKKSLPQLSSSSNRLSKNISSTTEKTVHQTLDDDQPCDFFKKGNRVNESHQKSSTMNAGPSPNKVQRSKNSSGKRQSKSQVPHVSSQLKGSLVGLCQPTEHKLKESISLEEKPERSPLSAKCQGVPGNKLFLDLQSMKIIKGDADEDSASDLSDSERIPVPPSPLTPPDLNLRAEEIDPVDFDVHPGQGQTKPEYYYPDFLPPPFNSWDLRDMAVLLNAEHRTGAVPRTGGLLGKYVDRLIQLEWLQIQTVQSEKGKGVKARPPTAPGTSGALKSPGRSKLIASALSKPHREGAPLSGPSRKKDLQHEEVHPSYYTFEISSKPLEVLSSSRLCSQKQTFDMRTEEKKKKSNKSPKLQRWDLSCSDGSPKIESSGNIQIPKQSAMILDSVDSYKASRTQAHANLKKKGKANNCGHATISSEKKLKTNGVKQNTHKFK